MVLFYVGNEENIVAAINQIDTNCGFPLPHCGSWATPMQCYNLPEQWYFLQPPLSGYHNKDDTWTQAEMIEGIENVTLEIFDPAWLPPINP